MSEVIAAVAATQETAVTELPHTWSSHCAEAALPAQLPFGPNEQNRYRANGGAELTTEADMENFGAEEAGAKLYFTVPGATAAEDQWPEAMRTNLVLRSHDGQEIDAPTWTKAFEESRKALWSKSISDTASGRQPSYCSQREFLTAHALDVEAAQHLQQALIYSSCSHRM